MSEASGPSAVASPGEKVAREDTSSQEPTDGAEEEVVSVSAVFHPQSGLWPEQPDTVLLSSDRVFFYVHARALREHSAINFSPLLAESTPSDDGAGGSPPLTIVPMDEDSHTLNVMLHTLYALPCAHFQPSDHALVCALAGLRAHGFAPASLAAHGTPLFALLAARTVAAPLFVYMLAGEHRLEALARAAAPHLLATRADKIPDGCAARMGAAYLHRLLGLQQRRLDTLKELLRAPPFGHCAVIGCSAEAQQSMVNAWTMTAAHLIYEARPELTVVSIEVTFEGVAASIRCAFCKAAFNERLAQVSLAWAQVPRTI